ncbi:hypothetical protein [Antrihabitans stalactiti]|uniref:Uncharacterized protein n=1 Tax=Antrihabitans stalactiti TaxID=2584121 RepID=A0A848KBG8_9NOCA|nr:hypothetical protein [Antrihabitans stalactiti]NMN96223.1 hypothetical protein [Antrihabitans stalactiti]
MSSVDEILDAGAHGLSHFAAFLPAYGEVTGRAIEVEQLLARYNAQRGMKLDVLEADTDAIAQVCDALDAEADGQRTHVRALESAWTDDASSAAAQDHLARLLDRASASRSELREVLATMTAAADGLRDVVHAKSDVVGGLTEERVAGKTADDIAVIVAGSKAVTDGVTLPLSVSLATHFPDLTVDLALALLPIAPAREHVATRCAVWLREVFVPLLDAQLKVVDELCKESDIATKAMYKSLTGSMNSVDSSAYPMPNSSKPAEPSRSEALLTGLSETPPQVVDAPVGGIALEIDPPDVELSEAGPL